VPKELEIPGHLDIAKDAAMRLSSGEWSTNEVLIAGLADLESFVRTRPDDQPFIDAGPLEDTPIAKFVVNTFEEIANAQSGRDSYGERAVLQIGLLVGAIKTLEQHVLLLNRRVAELEPR
jgi:hypothetical protein